MTTRKRPPRSKAPPGLTAEARALWTSTNDEYSVETAADVALLRQLCGLCYYCGQAMAKPTAEHLQAKHVGGPDSRANIVAACRRCNHGRHADANCRGLSVAEYALVVLLEREAGLLD